MFPSFYKAFTVGTELSKRHDYPCGTIATAVVVKKWNEKHPP